MNAQLGFCAGNSGDPIFTETFGTGGETALPFGTTTYTYANGIDPNDGFYKVTSTTNYFDWFDITDHTSGDTNGRMLLVNSDFSPGEFYRTSITGLCENTTYQFSAWLINVTPSNGFCSNQPSGAIPINVGFEIWDSSENSVLGSGSTGDILSTSSPNWQEYALVFQTLPGQTSIVLKMRNNGAGGCGNDLAIDDIVFKSCGDSIIIEDDLTNNESTICITETPYSRILNAIPDNVVFSSHFYQWQESSDGVNWNDILGETSASLSLNNVVTTSFYRTKVAEDAINVNNSSCNTLSDVYQVMVNDEVIPDFDSVGPICSGQIISGLPLISNNGINGTWNPALDNLNTTTYTFTPDVGECATTQTMTIVVNPIITPTFDQVAPICSGDMLNALSTVSNEGINGTWSPALDNTNTTTYTFTPNLGECASSQTMTITVDPLVTPTFDQIAPLCDGDILNPLPTISNEGISGIWSPILNNTNTTTYTFIPSIGQCATTQSMTITVNPIVIPTFDQVEPVCTGDILNPLPTTSKEGISGTWSPALDNTTTTTYTFTPNSGACSVTQTMTIVVNPNEAPVFTQVPPICSGDTLSPLPTTSNNGITGTWNPVLNNERTTIYTFTPDPGFCPRTVSMTIEINPLPQVALEREYLICSDATGLIVSPAVINTGLTSPRYEFTWFLNGIEQLGSNSGSYIAIDPGDYEVLVLDTFSTAIPQCQNSFETSVIEIEQPIVEASVKTDAFSSNNIIEVSILNPNGIYEYSLDGGTWQESPEFNNVSIGGHKVAVRDVRGCLEGSDFIVVMGYPRYFTPNGDGFNETWNITAPTNPVNYLASARIRIFDRYGKLLKQLNPIAEGWGGFYNGAMMPADDYWFVVEYIEPRTGTPKTFRSHFTLKR